MSEFLILSQNLPYTISLGLMLAIALLEGAGLILGIGIFSFLDNLLPDIDIDLDTNVPDGVLTSFMGWMNFGRVPLLVIAVCFLAIFGLFGLIGQYLVFSSFGFLTPLLVSLPLVFLISLPITKSFTNFVHKVMPKDESSALSLEDFIGKSAIITLGKATFNSPAEAKVTDKYGQSHYFMVEPEEENVVFEQGESVLLSKINSHGFYAIKNEYNSLK